MSADIDIKEKIKEMCFEADFNTAFCLSVHQAMSPVINDLRVQIVELRSQVIYLEQQLTERGGK